MGEEEEPAKKKDRAPGKKRLAIVLSVFVYILAGIPFWWRLTEVYRAPLPFGDVETLSKQVSSSALALPCQLQLVILSNEAIADKKAWRKLLLDMQQRLGNLNETGCPQLDVVTTLDARGLCCHEGDETAGFWECGYSDYQSIDDEDGVDESLNNHIISGGDHGAGKYSVFVFLDGAAAVGARIGKHRHAWITWPNSSLEENGFKSLVSETATFVLGSGSHANPIPIAADGTAILSFSLLNANPKDWIFDWKFDQVVSRYLSPVINALEPVARLSVESQVLYYTPSAAKSQWSSASRSHLVDSKEASFFVNANEWHLDTSTAAAGRSKLLHFAIYVPARNECPLRFKVRAGKHLRTGVGFTSPGWGGVVIWNPPGCSVSGNNSSYQQLSADDLRETMEEVVFQLRTLFGLSVVQNEKLSSLRNSRTGFAEWELDMLLRRRALADLKSTSSTLTSLLKLVESLPKMVIQDEIGVQVKTSLESAKKAIDHQTVSYDAFAEEARKARAWADVAFFHPSIMSLLHFPKEHQFAMYTPFFAPVLLNTLPAVVKEIKRYLKKRKEATQAAVA